MSLDETIISNKMMTTPPAKKGFHFASDGVHFAQFIEAETAQEAEKIYHQTKRLLFPTNDTPVAPTEQSTPVEEIKEETNG